ncbi:MAG: hypothetical protein R2681_09500 [Pyrinomonadaceae bacterium]
MWNSRTKHDLMIEVWEKLDCENIGRAELEAIEIVVREEFGDSAVESPMRIARLLADEGAELRHAEILALDVERRLETPYAPMFRNILKTDSLRETLSSIRQLENLRRKFQSDNDKEGLRLVRENAISGKKRALEIAGNQKLAQNKRLENAEIAEWLTIWLGSPEVFENWVNLRQSSEDFKNKFESRSEDLKE